MTWLAFQCLSGYERDAARGLQKLHAETSVPMEYYNVRGRGKLGRPIIRQASRPLLSGYVFAMWKDSVPWPGPALGLIRTRRNEAILISALRHPGGLLARIPQSDIDALEAVAAMTVRPSGGRGYRKGDMVRARVGQYDASVPARVVEIKGGLLRLESVLLGKAHLYDRRPDQVEAA